MACKPASLPGGTTRPPPAPRPPPTPSCRWPSPNRRRPARRKNFPTCPGKKTRPLRRKDPKIMKPAYELAMERLSKTAPVPKISNKQKKALAELDSKCAAKIAEREIFLKGELEKAAVKNDFEAYQQLEKQLLSDRKNLQSELEEKKEKVRQG